MTFDELLKKDGSVKVHNRNIQKLVTEMYKVKHHLSPIMMHNIFTERNYNGADLRSQTEFEISQVNSVNNGQETLRFL